MWFLLIVRILFAQDGHLSAYAGVAVASQVHVPPPL